MGFCGYARVVCTHTAWLAGGCTSGVCVYTHGGVGALLYKRGVRTRMAGLARKGNFEFSIENLVFRICLFACGACTHARQLVGGYTSAVCTHMAGLVRTCTSAVCVHTLTIRRRI